MLGAALALGMTVARADSPALLREDAASIESNLHLPDGTEPGRYDVLCEMRVRPDGTSGDVNCYGADSVPQILVKAVVKASERAQFVPATRDGQPAQVYMVLMVRVVIANGEPLVLALPNNGVEHARLGLFYIAPQRFNEFGQLNSGLSRSSTSANGLVWQELWVDEHGKVTSSKLKNESGAPRDIVEAIQRSVDNMQFMPGLVDGKPVAMRYLEPSWVSF